MRFRLRWIEPGSFLMGSPEDERKRIAGRERQHEVTLSRGYWIGVTEVTQALWTEVTGKNPSKFKGPDRPVENVSWNDAQEFIGKLNIRVPGLEVRLPTEAEWERACRAGTTTPFSFGANITTDQVNYNGNRPYPGGRRGTYRRHTVPVASLLPNPWGLYEIHGNVWEWCADWYSEDYPTGPVTDPPGPAEGSYRVRRGGSWVSDAKNVRSAYRIRTPPSKRRPNYGFRLARGQ